MPTRANVIPRKLLTVAVLLVSSLWLTPAKAGGSATTDDRFVIGTGLVIGLPGTGDSEVDDELVESSIVGVLKRAGLNLWHDQMTPGRVARVVVTAELRPGAKDGTPLSIAVTAVGDATSLVGGTLLPTPLRHTDGQVYSVGQGRIVMNGRIASVENRPVIDRRLQELAATE